MRIVEKRKALSFHSNFHPHSHLCSWVLVLTKRIQLQVQTSEMSFCKKINVDCSILSCPCNLHDGHEHILKEELCRTLSRDHTQWNHCNHCKKNDHDRCCNNVIEAFQCSVTYIMKKLVTLQCFHWFHCAWLQLKELQTLL